MELLVERIKAILNGSPTRTMPLSQLLESLSDSGVQLEGRTEWLVQRLSENSDLFRIIPDRLGPWIQWPDRLGAARPKQGYPGDPWIMAGPNPNHESGRSLDLLDRLRETLMAWGWEVDDGSQVGIARWLQANREAGLAVEKLLNSPGSPIRTPPSTTPPPAPLPRRRIPPGRPSAKPHPAGHRGPH